MCRCLRAGVQEDCRCYIQTESTPWSPTTTQQSWAMSEGKYRLPLPSDRLREESTCPWGSSGKACFDGESRSLALFESKFQVVNPPITRTCSSGGHGDYSASIPRGDTNLHLAGSYLAARPSRRCIWEDFGGWPGLWFEAVITVFGTFGAIWLGTFW